MKKAKSQFLILISNFNGYYCLRSLYLQTKQ